MADVRRSVSRRGFLAGLGAASFLAVAACAPEPPAPPPGPPPPPPGPPPSASTTLVVCVLHGGNDGLNTVIPHTDLGYVTPRGALALGTADGVLPLAGGFALHPAMPGLKALWDAGDAAIVHGVGYPQPDRSHFRSTDIWDTARPDAIVGSGWLGRWLDTTGDPLGAVCVTGTLLPALRGSARVGIATSTGALSIPGSTGFRNAFAQLATNDGADPQWATTYVGSQKDLLRAQAVLNPSLSAANPTGSALGALTTGVGRQFAAVARMIRDPNVPARVFMTNQGGYDTHAGQLATHAALLGQLDTAVKAFHDDLAAEPRADGVIVMFVSEFGRRLGANANGGTDHGTCAPVIVTGRPVVGGFHGTAPSLTALDPQGDPIYTTDFRSVYATVLARTLRADADTILGTSAFAPMTFV
ncbi:MAG: DUF1501 domain-containing protein [Acidimicrobiia bacterium]|jgi:uncharacterized protein (DUF1501 family)